MLKAKQRDQLLSARSDVVTINATYGLLSNFVAAVGRQADFGAVMANGADGDHKEMGDRWLDHTSSVLQSVREKIAVIMDELGDYLNDGNAVPGYSLDLAVPVFELLQKRARGEFLSM